MSEYDDAHDREVFHEFLERMEADYTDQVIAGAEVSLAATAAATETPMPNTAHPIYAELGPVVRSYEHDRDHIRLPKLRRTTTFVGPEETHPEAALETSVLTRHKCVGGAPFVGDPRYQRACYVWSVWMDNAGRHIATDAWLVRS